MPLVSENISSQDHASSLPVLSCINLLGNQYSKIRSRENLSRLKISLFKAQVEREIKITIKLPPFTAISEIESQK